jgi:hypothetical protein
LGDSKVIVVLEEMVAKATPIIGLRANFLPRDSAGLETNADFRTAIKVAEEEGETMPLAVGFKLFAPSQLISLEYALYNNATVS